MTETLPRFRSEHPTGGVLPTPPLSVRVLRTLGEGRAARAQLVEATMPDGQVVTCVEKVFAPGLLTRVIYRISFQSPFGYQSNGDAIRACFFRRRVAAAVIAATDIDAKVAQPLYVRFDQTDRAWVLAAEWIDGRGIKPEPANTTRMRNGIKRIFGKSKETERQDDPIAEVDQLVALMDRLEESLGKSGLVGSGWQVAPRAMVSTANLLRRNDRYTIIDLESGIPAVLVPRYILRGLWRATLPPFDDLDESMVRRWFHEQTKLLTFRLGPAAVRDLSEDINSLIEHTAAWKQSEFAILRRPWRHFTFRGMRDYQNGCLRRWKQDGIVDESTACSLPTQPLKSRAIWWAGCLPGVAGRFLSRVIGNRSYRAEVKKLLFDRGARQRRWAESIERRRAQWIESGRLSESAKLNKSRYLVHRGLQKVTPRAVHRWLTDRATRREAAVRAILLLMSPRYQSYFGGQRVESAIDRWQDRQRITASEADQLRQDLRGHEVLAYTRGFGMHLALKTLAPVILPAKVGGLAAFIASGNFWFLLPMLVTPALRTLVTLWSAWTTRHQQIPHGEAFLTGLLPVVGSVAFPMQMFSARPRLSTFLIRDAASKLGRRLPIYGGADSRTEMMMLRATDPLIESMQLIADRIPTPARDQLATEPSVSIRTARWRLGRWLERTAIRQIQREESNARPVSKATSAAAA